MHMEGESASAAYVVIGSDGNTLQFKEGWSKFVGANKLYTYNWVVFTLARQDEIVVDAYNVHYPYNADGEGVSGSEYIPLSDTNDDHDHNDDANPLNFPSDDEVLEDDV